MIIHKKRTNEALIQNYTIGRVNERLDDCTYKYVRLKKQENLNDLVEATLTKYDNFIIKSIIQLPISKLKLLRSLSDIIPEFIINHILQDLKKNIIPPVIDNFESFVQGTILDLHGQYLHNSIAQLDKFLKTSPNITILNLYNSVFGLEDLQMLIPSFSKRKILLGGNDLFLCGNDVPLGDDTLATLCTQTICNQNTPVYIHLCGSDFLCAMQYLVESVI